MKEIKGFNRYMITEQGLVWNKRTKDYMVTYIHNSGYERVLLTNDEGKKQQKLVHRLIAEAFIPNPENKPEVNHINGVKSDNQLHNLEWCTKSENQKHAIKMGLSTHLDDIRYDLTQRDQTGEKNSQAKLTYGEVVVIKKLLKRGNMKQKEIAEFFKVSPSTITDIKKGKKWSHV